MNKQYRKIIAVAALSLMPALLYTGSAVAESAADLESKVMAAKTPADHEAIAAAYDKQADAALKEAQNHKRLAKFYHDSPVGRGEGMHGMASHCENIAKNYESSAASFKEMAKAHRAAAAGK